MREDNYSNVKVMIKRLIWTILTPMSSVLKKADKLNLSLSLSLSCDRIVAWVLTVKLLSGECHKTTLLNTNGKSRVGSQCWFRWWLGAIKRQAIIWAGVDPDICCHMASLGHSELKCKVKVIWIISYGVSHGVICCMHDNIMTWKCFLHHRPFLRGIHRWPVDYPQKIQ